MAIHKVVTIEISDYGTKLCEVSYNKKNPTVYNSMEFKNPYQSVEEGFILDRVAYVGALREAIRKAAINCKHVVFTLTSNKVLSREVIIPLMKEKLVSEYLENEKDSYFPMDISNHALSYHILETKKELNQIRIMVYGAPMVLIKNYQTLAAEMDFVIVALDYVGNSIYQWLREENNQQYKLYLQINERNAMFTILENGVLALQRNINFGTDTLVQNVIDSKFYGTIDETAAKLNLKLQDNFFSSFAQMHEIQVENEKEQQEYEFKKRMTELVRPLIGNIYRVLEYYDTKNREAKLTTVNIGGSGTEIKGLKELLESEFGGLGFETLVNLPGLNVKKGFNTCINNSSAYIACVGASHSSINFLEENRKEKMKKSLLLSLVGLGIVTIASGLIVYNGFAEYITAKDYQEELNKKITELSPIEAIEKAYLDEIQTLNEGTAIEKEVYRYNEEWNDILCLLESELPSSTVISSLVSANNGLTMNVTVDSKEEAAKFLLKLNHIEYFTSVSINGLQEVTDPETGVKSVTFSVACAYYEETVQGVEATQVPTEGGVNP